MKEIVPAGGPGTWFYPLTKVASEQLLPVYDKPMIYYPLFVLMTASTRDVLTVSTPEDTLCFEELLGDGSQFGLSLSYTVQPNSGGLAQAFLLGEDFIGDDRVAMMLSDNIFAGNGLKEQLLRTTGCEQGATVFSYYVDDPERFGIMEFDKAGRAVSIEEKPEKPKSNYCMTGLCFYNCRVVEFAKSLKPSACGELKITDLSRLYLEKNKLEVNLLGQGFTWPDAGMHESPAEVTNFVCTIGTHQHRKIAYLEEITYSNGWISGEQFAEAAESMRRNEYGKYLRDVLNSKYLVQ